MTFFLEPDTMIHPKRSFNVKQVEIERVLKSLVASQSGNFGSVRTSGNIYDPTQKSLFGDWKRGQFDFARRLAQITARHAARHKNKFSWKHHSIGLLRRLALVVMVASILSAQYI